MLQKGTPSKSQRLPDFLRTPARPLPRRSCGASSVATWDSQTPSSPSAAPWRASPTLPPALVGSPSKSLAMHGLASPAGHAALKLLATPAPHRQHKEMTTPPCTSGCLSPSALLSASSPLSQGCTGSVQGLSFHCGPSSKVASAIGFAIPAAPLSLSTPSKIVTISTPLRPCSRQRNKELQDDVQSAVEEQSVPLLRVALQRRHACAGDHVLHEAVRQGNSAAVRLLLQSRAEPNARCLGLDHGCEFPLQLAVASNFLRPSERVQIVDQLLRAKASTTPRRSDAEGNKPIHDAARRGESEIVLLLLRHNANPNALNAFGEAALELALRGSDFIRDDAANVCIEALLEAGASPFQSSGEGASQVINLPPRTSNIVLQASDPYTQQLLQRWSAWWRCRILAWIRSRGSGHPLCNLDQPELLLQVAKFL